MTINDLVATAFAAAKQKGFHDKPREFGTSIALIHGELSEALEAHRDNKRCTLKGENLANLDHKSYSNNVKGSIEEELADVVIRVCDLAGSMYIDLENHIIAKINFNRSRPHKNGRNY